MNTIIQNNKLLLTAAATLVTAALAGGVPAALAGSVNMQTDINMVNPDNNCEITVTPPGSTSLTARMEISIADGTSTVEPGDGGERFIDIMAHGAATCDIPQVQITQYDNAISPGNKGVRPRQLYTANGGIILAQLYMTRVLGYTATTPEAEANVVVATTNQVRGTTEFSEQTEAVHEQGEVLDTSSYSDTNYQTVFGTPRVKFMLLSSYYKDYGGPLSYTGNKIHNNYAAFENPIFKPKDVTNQVKLWRVGVGAMVSTVPMLPDGTEDLSLAYDGESVALQSTITVTPT